MSMLPKALMMAARQNSDVTHVTCLDLNPVPALSHIHVNLDKEIRLFESQIPYL